MPDVTANGLRFHVQALGDPSAPPVVMVHGLLTGNLASWYFGLAPVVARNHSVLLYDQRGHGRSERPVSGYTLTDLASDLDALTSDLAPFVAIGHSFGGLTALRYALDHPDRLTAVVMVDSFVPAPATGSRPPGVDVAAAQVWEARHGRRGITAGRKGGGRRRGATTAQALLGETTVLHDLRRDSVLDAAALSSIEVPVLCAVGSDSPFRSDVEALIDLLPPERCQVGILAGGHSLHLDAADELAVLVTDFLDDVRPLAGVGHA